MKKHAMIIALIIYFGLFSLTVMALGYSWYYYNTVPDQPIAFSHQKHISYVGLECTFCHEHVEQAPRPGIPSVQKCMSCHDNVAKDRPEIIKLTQFWQNQTPVPWVRIHTLPGHVTFTHKRHIKKGIDCTTCHGEVKAMDTIHQVRSLKMGWCVSCHRSRGASTDCWTCHR